MTIARLKELTEKLALAEDQGMLAHTRLQTVLSVAGAGVWDWDVTSNVLRWDDRMMELFGYTSGEFKRDGLWHLCSYSNFISRVHSSDRDRVQASIDSCLNLHKPYRITYKVVRPDRSELSLILAAGDVHRTEYEHRLVGVCLPAVGEE